LSMSLVRFVGICPPDPFRQAGNHASSLPQHDSHMTADRITIAALGQLH
jgi:hypothetical protein